MMIVDKLDKIYDTQTHFHMIAINDNYVDEGHPGWFGYCAVIYNNIEQFCNDGCEMLNDDVAFDLRPTYHGDYGYSAFAYTNISNDYPSICIELDISQVLQEVSDDNSLLYRDIIISEYDVKSMIQNREVSDKILTTVDDFKELAKSIKAKNN